MGIIRPKASTTLAEGNALGFRLKNIRPVRANQTIPPSEPYAAIATRSERSHHLFD